MERPRYTENVTSQSIKMPRQYTKHSEEDRQRVAECFDRGEDFVALAETLGIKRSTYSLLHRPSLPGSAGGRRRKLDQESVDFLVFLFDANPCITLREMKSTLHEIFLKRPITPTVI